MEAFLESSEVINWHDSRVLSLAQELAKESADMPSLARRIFEWVRDNIEHSVDFQRSEVTCCASEVLVARTGFCYAKSHLVAALMRANGIPTGLCYQRLSINDDGAPYCLHGLNAVFLEPYGWYRIDARGNTGSIQAEFSPPQEHLAFAVSLDGEEDLAQIHAEPLPQVVSALQSAESVNELQNNLPDANPSS